MPVTRWRAITLDATAEPLLQRFLEDNPGYFEPVHGRPARAGDAREEILGTPPAGWPWTRRWVVGYLDAHGSLAALVTVFADLPAPRVWHIGTFVVATPLRGKGIGRRLYRGIERWARDHGASWLRLVAVRDSAAQRFWVRQGFRQVRPGRAGTEVGSGSTLGVMVKSAVGGSLACYLARVARDLP